MIPAKTFIAGVLVIFGRILNKQIPVSLLEDSCSSMLKIFESRRGAGEGESFDQSFPPPPQKLPNIQSCAVSLVVLEATGDTIELSVASKEGSRLME